MKSVIERLPVVADYVDAQRKLYLESDIRALIPIVVDLLPFTPPNIPDMDPYPAHRPPGALLAAVEDGSHVEVAVFDFDSGPVFDFSTGDIVEPARYSLVFQGSGPAGALRELRHTTWGEVDNPGYLHYPSARLIAEAFPRAQAVVRL